MVQFNRLNCYYSFSLQVLSTGRKKLHKAVIGAPIERIILETDCPCFAGQYVPPEVTADAIHDEDGTILNEPKNIPIVLRGVAELRGEESLLNLQERIYQTSCRLFDVHIIEDGGVKEESSEM